MIAVLLIIICVILVPHSQEKPDNENAMSPFNQYLPKCSDGFTRIKKKTKEKALLCPMIK